MYKNDFYKIFSLYRIKCKLNVVITVTKTRLKVFAPLDS